LSPVKLDPSVRHAEEIADIFYPNNPLLCIARRGSWDFTTAPREAYRGLLHLCQLIVPSPMTALTGLTKSGKTPKPSAHTLNATGPRHFLVTELDFRKADEDNKPTIWSPYIEAWESVGITIEDACMALIMHLALSAPLALIVWSGG